jgi:hypothetical protein
MLIDAISRGNRSMLIRPLKTSRFRAILPPIEKANPRAAMHNSAFSKAKIRVIADGFVEFLELYYREIGRSLRNPYSMI